MQRDRYLTVREVPCLIALLKREHVAAPLITNIVFPPSAATQGVTPIAPTSNRLAS